MFIIVIILAILILKPEPIVKFLGVGVWLTFLFLSNTTMIIFALYEEEVIPSITNPHILFLNDIFLKIYSPIKQKITEYERKLRQTYETFNYRVGIN